MAYNPVQQLYDYLAEKAAKQLDDYKSPTTLRFRPSEIGGCKREIFYRLAGYLPRALDGRTQMLFRDGDDHHNAIRQMMREAGVEMEDLIFQDDGGVEETGIAKRKFTVPFGGKQYEIELSGRTDGSIRTEHGMDLLEIKSVGKYKFDKFQSTFLKGGEKALITLLRDEAKQKAGARPAPEHANRRFWYQFQTTMLAADRSALFVVFKNRDTAEIGLLDKDGERWGLRIAADADVQDTILQRCALILKALDESRPPIQDFMDGSMPCFMCSYYQHCWGAMRKDS